MFWGKSPINTTFENLGKNMASNTRIKIGLKCSECGDINYTTTKNSKKTTDKIELKKYCPRLKKHTVHKETKLK